MPTGRMEMAQSQLLSLIEHSHHRCRDGRDQIELESLKKPVCLSPTRGGVEDGKFHRNFTRSMDYFITHRGSLVKEGWVRFTPTMANR